MVAQSVRLDDQAQELLTKGGHHVLFFYNHATMNEALAKRSSAEESCVT